MAAGLDYLLAFNVAIASVNPNELADSIYDQMLTAGACTTLDEGVIKTAVYHTYSAMLGASSLTADLA